MDTIQSVHLGGANESLRESRDVIHQTTKSTIIPNTWNTDYSNIPVEMQYKIGICVAEGVLTAIEKFRNDGIRLSRTFFYNGFKRYVDGNLEEGSSIKSALIFAQKIGTQPISVVPDNITGDTLYSDFIKFDPTPYYATATKIPGYINIPVDPVSLASGIMTYNGLIVRYTCGATWYSDANGITWDPARLFPLKPPYPVESGHCVVLTAYNYEQGYKSNLRNSWSAAWGINGDGYSFIDQYGPTEAWGILPVSPIIPPTYNHTFSIDMSLGQSGPEIIELQRALKLDGTFPFSQDATGYYGPITQEAVRAFQVKYKVANAIVLCLNAGKYAGPSTRKQLNKLFSSQ